MHVWNARRSGLWRGRGLRSSIPSVWAKSRHLIEITYRSGRLDSDLGHTNVRPVEVLDCLVRVLWCLVAHIADASLGHQLDISDLATLRGEVLPKVSLCDVGWQAPNEYSWWSHCCVVVWISYLPIDGEWFTGGVVRVKSFSEREALYEGREMKKKSSLPRFLLPEVGIRCWPVHPDFPTVQPHFWLPRCFYKQTFFFTALSFSDGRNSSEQVKRHNNIAWWCREATRVLCVRYHSLFALCYR